MTDPELAALEAIVAAPLAWSPIADLKLLGHTPETLAGLQALGLVEPWGSAADLVWTLTPWGATVLEVVIIEHGPNEVPRWSQPWNAPRFVRVPRHRHEMRWPWMEELPSRDLGPLDVLILGEDAKPLLLFGRTVVKDKRIKPPPRAKKAKAKRRRKAG
ncbi:hypothetical protein [Singulisphaera acidiphila]|uniref:Uncharacterized protein n=1 Tax=Singulisphaera acidiphila (strain ATCC BAA-1392 / DSM 18658 / VKM B-2454 / MOB10) TaxID=886293 RepID=L0DIP0_SINAD|nr:hypothetical protein [Singulisphaera acidiphila]AGA28720.1 hypothetical protein Sinac_4539 [Singulisphaera acidiphila DSM 18658]